MSFLSLFSYNILSFSLSFFCFVIFCFFLLKDSSFRRWCFLIKFSIFLLFRINQSTPLSSTGNASSGVLTTGDDTITPSFNKKRIISRNSSKTHTPTGSPSSHTTTLQQQQQQQLHHHTQLSPKANNNITSLPSVHRLFANDFFNNVSLGYDLLLHTFQYLKVQVSHKHMFFTKQTF